VLEKVTVAFNQFPTDCQYFVPDFYLHVDSARVSGIPKAYLNLLATPSQTCACSDDLSHHELSSKELEIKAMNFFLAKNIKKLKANGFYCYRLKETQFGTIVFFLLHLILIHSSRNHHSNN
jgi:hypothetical protein